MPHRPWVQYSNTLSTSSGLAVLKKFSYNLVKVLKFRYFIESDNIVKPWSSTRGP